MVYIAIINWRSSSDTIECLESVFRLDSVDFCVIVCDNDSGDGSLDRLKAWAAGEIVVQGASLREFTTPEVPKPIRYLEYDRKQAEAGGDPDATARLILVQTGANLGYAGGNNVALRYALARNDCAYVWLLNNDTVVEPAALSRLVRRLDEVPEAGMCGSLTPYYDEPGRIWAQGGGTINRWLAKSACIGNGRPVSQPLAPAQVERALGYIAGSSLLVSRDFLEQIGLLCEDYFLYYEEPDWAARARGRFTLAYAPESVVYHKVGVSTAVLNNHACSGKPTDGYIFRNALRFTRRFFPIALPLVFIRVLFNRVLGYCLYLVRSRVGKG